MNNSSVNVQIRTEDPKIVKKLRKAVEKILEAEKAADDKISYSIDTSYNSGRQFPMYGRRPYQGPIVDEG